jgi:hypothetical protein
MAVVDVAAEAAKRGVFGKTFCSKHNVFRRVLKNKQQLTSHNGYTSKQSIFPGRQER